MKSLEIKPIDQELCGEGDRADYTFMVKAVANQLSKDGFTAEDVRKRMRIIDKLDETDDVLELEDADAELLKSLSENMRWGVVHRDIVKFVDDVKEMV